VRRRTAAARPEPHDSAWQELRDALASSSASLALPNAAAAQPRGLAADLAAALAAARAAGGKVGDFLLSDSCTEVRLARAQPRTAAGRSCRVRVRLAHLPHDSVPHAAAQSAQRSPPQT
jgi:hypothetical protein